MGTRVRLTVEAVSSEVAAATAEQALRRIESTEALLSTWREDSPLSELNRAEVGRLVTAPEPLLATLDEALTWSEQTGGAFDPAIGPLIEAWGVRSQLRTPTEKELAAARAASGSGAFNVDPAAGTAARTRPHAWIDAGGFGKGAALREVRDMLVEHTSGRAWIDLGGQVLAVSNDGSPWPLRIAHPIRRHEPAFRLRLVNASAATSGASERPGHLLDPRNGRTVTDWGSVTVVDSDPMVADILSTALYVMGPETGLTWASDEGVAALFLVPEDDRVVARWTPSMTRWLGDSAPSTQTQTQTVY